jgi:hypothetical protein
VLLVLRSPLPDSSLAGQEHGRTIPLGDIQTSPPASWPKIFDLNQIQCPSANYRYQIL